MPKKNRKFQGKSHSQPQESVRLPYRRAAPTIPRMTRYGTLRLFGPPCTRWVHPTPPMRTDHPHAGPGAHASHCSNQSPDSPGGAEGGADALGGPFPSYIPPSFTCCQSADQSQLDGWVGLSLLFLIWTKRGSGVRWRWGYAGCRCVIPMHAPAPALYRDMIP